LLSVIKLGLPILRTLATCLLILRKDIQGSVSATVGFYVTNSKPSIEVQIRKCLRHFNARVEDAMFIGGPPLNFVTGEIEDF